MNCKKFRDNHALFVDSMCSELEALEMQSHMRFCPECARHDTVVRRGILVVRNLPTVHLSPRFNERLSERIRAESLRTDHSRMSAAHYVSLAAALAVIALGVSRLMSSHGEVLLRMPPVVASKPVSTPSPFGNSSLVATVPTGMSIWPAIMMASQAPTRLVSTELAGER